MVDQPGFFELIGFFHDALVVSLLTGAILGPVGLFLHLRGSLFLGAALPQFAGFGFVVASVLAIPEWIASSVTIVFFAVAAAFKPLRKFDGMTLEAMIGLGYTAAMGGIVLLLSLTKAEGHAAELLLKGSMLAATCRDTQILSWFGVPLVLLLYLFRRRFYLVSLDPETAGTMGIRVEIYEIVLFAALGMAIMLTLTEAGAMACFGFLLLPPLIALTLCRRVGTLFLASMTIGAVGAISGVCLALKTDLPVGPAMVLALLCLWLAALVFRGVRKPS
ncbi:MAG TPA: iron chelate uptake ABC transporter family permease subunit [Candidatus Ozemobacteraceae bacterium]|nr:iron chelate uptake ABC transporter family permease subunit [Candidatus Ozemobacteraceae bacterium]HQG28999.1 iron chelate uptake ABC transporter family permease subunit [Candidatus Ozemobacteraceae bacterium]